jgi:predicted nucleic acid-binding protein
MGRLHAGELEAIVLAQEYHITHVALDDLLARNKAKQLGLTPIGTAGLLLLANAKGLISSSLVKIKLQALIERHGFYLSPRILEKVQEMLVLYQSSNDGYNFLSLIRASSVLNCQSALTAR